MPSGISLLFQTSAAFSCYPHQALRCAWSLRSHILKLKNHIRNQGVLRSISLCLSGLGVPHLWVSDFLSICCYRPGKATLQIRKLRWGSVTRRVMEERYSPTCSRVDPGGEQCWHLTSWLRGGGESVRCASGRRGFWSWGWDWWWSSFRNLFKALGTHRIPGNRTLYRNVCWAFKVTCGLWSIQRRGWQSYKFPTNFDRYLKEMGHRHILGGSWYQKKVTGWTFGGE